MNELYWITRFSTINSIAIVFMALTGIALSVALISIVLHRCEEIEAPEGLKEDYRAYYKLSKKSSIILGSLFTFFTLGVIFVPTTQEALLIYGVGGSIDYLKENPTAKQLPDKCIKALDKWVDNLAEEQEDSTRCKK